MATATEKKAATATAPKGESIVSLVMALALLTALGAGGGALLGLQIHPRLAPPAAGMAPAAADAKDKPRTLEGASLTTLPPIVTNLAEPSTAWIRLEAAIVLDSQAAGEANVLAGNIADDILAFLRTLTIGHIEGASGLQHLREDLSERARIRSGGKVRDVVLQTLVVE